MMRASVVIVIPGKPVASIFSFYLLNKIADFTDSTNYANTPLKRLATGFCGCDHAKMGQDRKAGKLGDLLKTIAKKKSHLWGGSFLLLCIVSPRSGGIRAIR
jgi:hypothetical protein